MAVYGDIAQSLVWNEFIRVYGTAGVEQVILDAGNSPSYATRLRQLMQAYWGRTDNSQQRGGFKYFPEFFRRLLFKPDDGSTPVPGDFSDASNYHFVAGGDCLHAILATEPEFMAVIPSPNSATPIDPTDIFDGFNYMIGFPLALSCFMTIEGDVWGVYVGASDTPIPDVCGQVIYVDPTDV